MVSLLMRCPDFRALSLYRNGDMDECPDYRGVHISGCLYTDNGGPVLMH